MNTSDFYHPKHALTDPNYYEEAFKSRVSPKYAQVFGRVSMALARPEFHYVGANSHDEYFDRLPEDISVAGLFTHDGEGYLEDPPSAAAAVFSSPFLMDRLDGLSVWVKNYYLTGRVIGPIVRPLGAVAVHPAKTLERFGLSPKDPRVGSMQERLHDASAHHLTAAPRRVLKIFPAGSKGKDKIRDGVGNVLERVPSGRVVSLPIALVYDTNNKEIIKTPKNVRLPKNLRIIYGEPFFAENGSSASDYVELIDERLQQARDWVKS